MGGLEWKLKFWRVKELLLKPHHKQQVYIWSLKTQVKQSSWGFNCSNDDDFCNARHDSCAVNHCNFMPDGRWRLPSEMMAQSKAKNKIQFKNWHKNKFLKRKVCWFCTKFLCSFAKDICCFGMHHILIVLFSIRHEAAKPWLWSFRQLKISLDADFERRISSNSMCYDRWHMPFQNSESWKLYFSSTLL